MKRKIIVLLTVLYGLSLSLLGCNNTNNDTPASDEGDEKAEWQLVFEENFDGNAVNTDNWNMYYSP
ncbi:MAG: hypothetical protein LBM08_15990, partial [Dysgonamonadaceae bacterium]|nr:hypothetical protein [Dysgonamonadaceae bacterium]